ncbi:hypothetical protein MNBD_NITROSPINAE04-2676 [hydrothermal vent metagenome]|uniref:Uncharacterized protein n=1 Tax=hydrothermal vent metagenome TaxID=652676 RepID=A0A3B1CPE5_9ZZZZ
MKIICAVIIACAISFGGPALAAQNEKINKLKAQILNVQNAGKLGVRDLTLCRKILGYGSYIPYSGNVIQKGKRAFLYFEPGNIFTSVSKGIYSLSFSEGAVITDSKGKIVFRNPKMVEFSYSSTKPLFDLFIRNHFSLNAPGEYIFKIVLYDELRGEKAKAEYAFTIK